MVDRVNRIAVCFWISWVVVSVGLEVRADKLLEPTFMPGTQIQNGLLIVDESRVENSGDLLHESLIVSVEIFPATS